MSNFVIEIYVKFIIFSIFCHIFISPFLTMILVRHIRRYDKKSFELIDKVSPYFASYFKRAKLFEFLRKKLYLESDVKFVRKWGTMVHKLYVITSILFYSSILSLFIISYFE